MFVEQGLEKFSYLRGTTVTRGSGYTLWLSMRTGVSSSFVTCEWSKLFIPSVPYFLSYRMRMTNNSNTKNTDLKEL